MNKTKLKLHGSIMNNDDILIKLIEEKFDRVDERFDRVDKEIDEIKFDIKNIGES
jgi:hypothetical protein